MPTPAAPSLHDIATSPHVASFLAAFRKVAALEQRFDQQVDRGERSALPDLELEAIGDELDKAVEEQVFESAQLFKKLDAACLDADLKKFVAEGGCETREQRLARLLKATWEALPPVLDEGNELETDMAALGKLNDEVAEVLAEEEATS